jgi:hypothetical protein
MLNWLVSRTQSDFSLIPACLGHPIEMGSLAIWLNCPKEAAQGRPAAAENLVCCLLFETKRLTDS